MDDTHDLQRHVSDVARLNQQTLQLRAQQLLAEESPTAMQTAKDRENQALTAEQTRKAGSADSNSGPCRKKQCKVSNTSHSKCNTAAQQKAHQKSHALH